MQHAVKLIKKKKLKGDLFSFRHKNDCQLHCMCDGSRQLWMCCEHLQKNGCGGMCMNYGACLSLGL